jgi:curli biogenesis system outer membrane secretion channel CsgG
MKKAFSLSSFAKLSLFVFGFLAPGVLAHAQAPSADQSTVVSVTKVVTNTVIVTNTVVVATPVTVESREVVASEPVRARLAVLPAIRAQKERSKFERELYEKFGISDPSVIEHPGYTAHLIDCLVNLRKFDVIERERLREVTRELDFAESDYADTQKCVKMGQMLNAHYVVIPELRFADLREERRDVPFIGQQKKRFYGLLGTNIRVVDVATGRIASSSIAEAGMQVSEAYRPEDKIKQGYTLVDQLMAASARQESDVIADVVYPIRVVAFAAGQVTLNRGRGAMDEGEVLKVYKVGEDMKDPDTGATLGQQEVEIGQVRVIKVNPQTSIAEVLQLDPGQTIKKRDVARRERKPKWQPPSPDSKAPKID